LKIFQIKAKTKSTKYLLPFGKLNKLLLNLVFFFAPLSQLLFFHELAAQIKRSFIGDRRKRIIKPDFLSVQLDLFEFFY